MNDADKTRKHLTIAQERRSVYDLLSAFYLLLPDEVMVESIFDPDFEEKLSAVASVFDTGEMQEGLKLIAHFISCFRNQPQVEVLRCMAVDRTRLFRGISEKRSPPPPYESVYREQRLSGESAAEVSRFYHKLGVTPPEASIESPDYFGTELDFMRLLCQREEEAWTNNQPDQAVELLDASGEFLRRHLLKWVPTFCEKMAEKAELDFYRGLAKLTKGFLEYDSQLVDERLEEIKRNAGGKSFAG